MPLASFVVATGIGATLWNSFLLVLGIKLREHWTLVQTYSHQVDVVVVVLLLAACVWYVRSRLPGRRKPASRRQ